MSIAQRSLMPGVITAAALNLPILSFLAGLALKQGYISGRDAVVFSIAVPLLLLMMTPLLFGVGRLVVRAPASQRREPS